MGLGYSPRALDKGVEYLAKWRVNDTVIEPAPTEFALTPTKEVQVKKTIENREIRISPYSNKHYDVLELRWDSIGPYWYNEFYDAHINDEIFTIQSHLYDETLNPNEIWTVRVQNFSAIPKRMGERWQLQLTLETVRD